MNRRIYFDNAATTSLDPVVLEAMMPYFTEKFGNASSIHSYGREARMAVEQARKQLAGYLNVKPGELFFTGGGTESTATVIQGCVRDLGVTRIITSPIEHHATLHNAEFMQALGKVELQYVRLNELGHVDLQHLAELLHAKSQTTLVTLMHANNEIGNITDIVEVGELCEKYGAYFHSDTVQTMAHFYLDLPKTKTHFVSASAHKFHGPKGSGLMYIRNDVQLKPLLVGGGQERNMRAGTENTAGIVGFAKSFERSMQHHEEDAVFIRSLKEAMAEKLLQSVPDIRFHGDIGERSLYTVLNVGFPKTDRSEVLSMNLDIAGICVSGGSACGSGAQGGSHVIQALYPGQPIVPVRFSFSKHNTFEEVDGVVSKISELLN